MEDRQHKKSIQGFVSLRQWWRTLLHRVFAKQPAKREQSHPVCLHAVEKYENVESVNKQNNYERMSKK